MTQATVYTVEARDFLENPRTEVLTHYARDGVIQVKGLFRPEDFAGIRQDLARRIGLLETRYFGAPSNTVEDDISALSQRMIALEQAHPESQGILYDSMNHTPAMHGLVAGEQVSRCIERLLSPVYAIHSRLILLMSMPENQWHLPVWHQDWYYNEGPYSSITAYIPLQRTTEENGSLLMALGEHHNGFVPHGEYDHGVKTKWHSLPPEVVEGYQRVASTHLELGDALFFNSLVPHCARLNRSGQVRFVLNFRFQDLTDQDFIEQGWHIPPLVHARNALARQQA